MRRSTNSGKKDESNVGSNVNTVKRSGKLEPPNHNNSCQQELETDTSSTYGSACSVGHLSDFSSPVSKRKKTPDEENTGSKKEPRDLLNVSSSSDDSVDLNWLERIENLWPDIRDAYRTDIEQRGFTEYKRVSRAPKGRVQRPVCKNRKKPVRLSLVEIENAETTSPKSKYPTSIARDYMTCKEAQKVNSGLLPAVRSIPAMQYWALTERNVAVDDERTLSHIPFIGDEGDEDFGAELMRTFEEGIHGTKAGCPDFFGDCLLFRLIRKLQTDFRGQFNTTNQKQFTIVAKAIAEYFPNKLSFKQIINTWSDLAERYAGERDVRLVLPNVDSEDAAVTSVERTLHSYATLFCRRCINYDCLLHDFKLGNSSDPLPPKKRRKIDHAAKVPCCADCYRVHCLSSLTTVSHHPDKINNSQNGPSTARSPRRLMSHQSSTNVIVADDTANNYWSSKQQTMFNVLRRTCCDDFCKIARALSEILPKNAVNCKQVCEWARRCGPSSPRQDYPQSPVKARTKRGTKDQHRTFRAIKWSNTEDRGHVQNEHVYHPCNHPGQLCSDNELCSCTSVNNLCTKFCRCTDTCRNRFPGCRCQPGGCRTKQCQCYFANWECDPDICKSCHSDIECMETTENACRNVNIQRSLQKRLLVAPSDVAGWGCFAASTIDKGEFISEYCGEVISQDEAERRGKIYDKHKCSYLFGLNKESAVDATRKGNLIRFANHSKKPNCRAKVLMVNGDHRIGIFADRHIGQGEELFFDYSYNKAQQVEFVSKELNRKRIAEF